MTGGHEHKKSSSSAGQSQGREHNLPLGSCIENPCWDDLETPGRLLLKHRVDMDEEDGRCLLDVICDPQALNDFLHGPDQIGGDDLLDNTGDAASAFFVGTGLHVQEAPGNHLTTESNPPTSSVDLDFLEDDDILGSPSAGSASLASADQPCDILQQSLQEANITEQTLEAEAELDLGSFQLPTLQPVVQAAPDGTPQIFSGGADLIGLQQPAVLTHQALVQQSVGGDVVNKAISVQPFLQQVGLGNVTIQPISNLPGLPNGSPGGALGIGQIQVVGQQVMAINQPAQQIIAKQVQSTQVANLPVGSYLTGANTEQQQVTLTSSGVSPQNTGLVLQNKIPTVATTLNGNSMFGSVSAAQCTQSLTVTSSLNSPVIIQRTPTPIQPKPAGVLPQKLFQISPKPFTPNNATLTIQGEAALQQPKTQQNLAFMTGKPGPNVLLSSFPQGLPTNMFKQPPSQQHSLGKPMSVHLLNQGSSIVIPAQHAQAMLQGQNQFLLPGQLAGASAVQPLSALQANMGGQILAASHPSGQAHIIASQGPGGQLLNQALPAQILTNQNIASQLNLGQVLASQNAHGTAHIFSGQIQLQAGQVGQPTLFQMPVSLAGSLSTQSQASVATSLNQAGQTVIQGVTLPNQVAMFNPSENLGQAVSIQQTPGGSSQSPGIVQQQSQQVVQGSSILPNADQASILTVQTAQQASHGQPQLQLNVQQQTQPQQTIPVQSQPSPSLATSPDKIILGGTPSGTILSAESMQMFLQQKNQQFYEAALKMQQESSLVQTSAATHVPMPIYSLAASASTLNSSSTTTTSSSVPASVIVSSSAGSASQLNRELVQNLGTAAEPKGQSHIPHFPSSQSQQALACQIPSGQQKLPGASPSHSLPHPPSPQLQPSSSHLSQMQSPHQSRPPSQPQPLSRPPSRPHSRPPSQPQSVPRPPSEPLSRSCTPQMQNLFVIQNQIASPHGSSQHPLRPPSQPQVQTPFASHQPSDIPQTLSSPQQHIQLQVQLSTPQSEVRAGVPVSLQATPPSDPQTHSFQLQFPIKTSISPQTAGQPLHLTADSQRTFQMTQSQIQALSLQNSVPQQKQLLERYQQMQQLQQGLMLPSHQPATSTQTSPALGGQYSGQAPSVLTSGQGQSVPTQGPLLGHSPGQVQVGGSSQTAHLSTLLQQQQATVLVNNSGPATVPLDANVYPGTVGKSVSGQSKSIATLPVQTPAKTAVISSVSGLSLGKGSVQIQFVGKGISQIVPTAQTTTQPQFESKFGALKTLPTLQPSKEACFLEHLHKHQGSVLHPDYKSPFHSFEDAFHRLLPYHVYQGLLPTTQDLRKVDDEFEVVSTQLLKRTQAMLNKYRLLLLEESRRVSPSAEMVMIDRMFIQEEKVTLSLDRQLAKERPDEYVSSSSSRSQTFVPTTPSVSSSPCPVSTPETLKPTVVQTSNPIHPTKLVIKHSGGGSPSVTWAKASPSLDTDEDALPSRSRPPIKTYEARSRIGLKLKIKQEAGLSKVIHNTALDPVHQNPPPPLPPPAPPTVPTCTVIKAAVQSSPATITTPTGQMNGTLEHSLPAEKKPLATYCRLPLRKTYRENVDAFVTGKPGGVLSKMDKPAQPPPVMQQVKQEDGSRSVITSHKTQGSSNTEKAKKEESAKLGIYNRVESKLNNSDENPVVLRHDVKDDDQSYYRRIIKTEPPDNETELNWEMQLPSAKRLKTEHFDVDNASFSSDSPQDDTLNEHLQSAIDSILNLQQPQSGAGTNSLLRSSTQTSYHHSSSSSPFSSPVHRTDSYLTPNHNGGLGTRTLNR
ncbi:BRD4-interacting chromatin-remodeling complex-associated protein isoform X2 [Xenopus laevis]|nr:BRD4-interacting chromatin-remodeling complex-associated protein isoform X2 [Xenopus laevis]XP_018085752.1 BRD4-interacting chromatin-remodeling complex-associated protein isoform X2 [Xenopus laevis]